MVTVFISGATGVMGRETLKTFYPRLDKFRLRILARKSKKNIKLLKPYINTGNVDVIWGDLTNPIDVASAIGNAEYVLHIGGMVSPAADHYPKQTMHVNTISMKNIIDAVKQRIDSDNVKVVYIGSIAETGNRAEPYHWGRIGDPVNTSPYDYYGLSKILAERMLVESGLKKWVVLRQSGILHNGLLARGMDPITFHVPLRGVLEWTTAEDSGRLMANICKPEVPEKFWNNIYHIGSGKEYRLSNYRFEQLILKALNCPKPEKIFEPSWFATRNFHGLWFADSDLLESMVPFRENLQVEEYFKRMSDTLPAYFKLAGIVPSFIMKFVMKTIANGKGGTLNMLKNEHEATRVKVMFKSEDAQKNIAGWENTDLSEPSEEIKLLSHGYDESKEIEDLDLNDLKSIAEFRGGKLVSAEYKSGAIHSLLEWECGRGHKFKASPMLVVRGGHWCDKCLPAPWRYDEEAKFNPFFAQVWYSDHDPDENNVVS